MNSQIAVLRLDKKSIRPTANRILVLKALATEGRPLTLAALENILPTMDKSSIFRVLNLFLAHDVVHTFEDGRGTLNYELCESEGACAHTDDHVHFYCETCHRTFCLDPVNLLSFTLPQGFVAGSLSFVIKGVCAECAKQPTSH